MNGSPAESGVALSRVVAVVATLADGREQVGTGYLVTSRLVLTARHCTRDKTSGAGAATVRVIRASDLASTTEVTIVASDTRDIAVLLLAAPPWHGDLPGVSYGRVDRSQARILTNCAAIGYPSYQRDSSTGLRGHGELHGTIYATDQAEIARLLMREQMLSQIPPDKEDGRSLWGGMSGAVVFHAGFAIGVVVEHHPRQGDSAVQLETFDGLCTAAASDAGAAQIVERLGLGGVHGPSAVNGEPVIPVAGLVARLDPAGGLPRVDQLAPYQLGVTTSDYGAASSYGADDRYVPRTNHDVDEALYAALEPGKMVIVQGPSKVGKSRTAFEIVKRRWAKARIATPNPETLADLIEQPTLQATSDPIVLWLDDVHRFLTTSRPLNPVRFTRLLTRPGATIVLATLRTDAAQQLRGTAGELGADTRTLLQEATVIELTSTSNDPREQAAAHAAYPDQPLGSYGLAERLGYAPELLHAYRNCADSDPVAHTAIRVAVDWARVGLTRPLPEADLFALAKQALWEDRPDLDIDEAALAAATRSARTPLPGSRDAAPLTTHALPGQVRGYRAYDYLVAADDGQATLPRQIPALFWAQSLALGGPDDAVAIGLSAYNRGNIPQAIAATRAAADTGHTDAMANLGYLLMDRLYPPDLDGARKWYTKAARAGHTGAMINLGNLLKILDPPDLDGARKWWIKAADAGDTGAMCNLGLLLATRLEPPDLDGARKWWTKAADAGGLRAMYNLGLLLATRLEPPDLDGARSWYTKAARAGHTDAMANLGYLLRDRLDPPDLDGARKWWTKAADTGDIGAMYNLGVLMADRLDPPDLDGARKWWTKAADTGDIGAMCNLGVLLADRLDPPDLDGARKWYTRAADAGDAGARCNLGVLLADRLDPPDLERARKWYTKAARAGHTDAMYNLGVLLADRLDPPDLERARKWYTKAADAGHTDAMCNLGVLLADRLDPPDLERARKWYTKAADTGDTDAMCNLGVLLADRLDPPDLERARKWYTKAARAGDTGAMYNLGVLLAERLDPPEIDKAATWLMKAAHAGHPGALEVLTRESW